MELRLVPMRIGNAENLLGSRRDGPVHPSHHRIRRPARHVDGVALCRMFQRFEVTVCPNTSARITIRCIDSTNGKPIFGSSK
jgi:hypothetical protein